MRALRIAVLVLIVLVSLLALLFLLPWLKEGFDREALPLFASVAGVGWALAAGWWGLNRRRHRGLGLVGILVLGLPAALYTGLSLRVLVNDRRGRRLAKTVRVVSLRESDIAWPGLPSAAGVRLEVELEHAVGLEGNLYPPKILMGTDPRPDPRDYVFGPLDHGVDAFLAAPLFERDPTPRDVLVRPGRVRIAYDLFPSNLSRRDGDAVCLRALGHDGAPRAPGAGSNLGAAWFFAAPGGVVVDLGPPLTEALRRGSRFQGRPAEWTALTERLGPELLEASGYAPCAPSRHGPYEACYCRSGTPSP